MIRGLTSGQLATSSSQPTLLGAQAKSYQRNNRYFIGDLAEFTVFDGLLSDTAAAQQLTQLAALYGITIPDYHRYTLPPKLLELKASGISRRRLSVGSAISTWSDTSGKGNHASSSGSVAGSYASPVLVAHTDSQGSVHNVVRFGCSSNCDQDEPTWGTPTPLQMSEYVYSTQSDGLEVWAVVRQPDTGDASHNTRELPFLFDTGRFDNLGYGLAYAAAKLYAYTPETHGGGNTGHVDPSLTYDLAIVRMRVVFGSGGVLRLERNGNLTHQSDQNLAGLTSSQLQTSSSQPTLLGAQSKNHNDPPLI